MKTASAFMTRSALLIAFLSSSFLSARAGNELIATEIADSSSKWHATANAQYKGGDSRHIGQLGFTLPISQDEDSLLFLDFRGRVDDQQTEEFNLGLAYRTILDNDWIFGVYGFFDRNTTAFGNEFDQGTVGFEFMSEDWDFRVNGYLPDLNGQDAGAAPGFGTVGIAGNQFSVNTQRFEERAYYGGDYEVGKRIAVFGETDNEIRVFGGGYYFDNDAAGFAHIAGGRLRLEARLFDLAVLGEGSRVTLSGEVQWDQVRETQGFGGIAVQIPIGRWGHGSANPIGSNSRYGGLSNLERRMYDPIIRDVDVVANAAIVGNAAEIALDAEGDPLRIAGPNLSLDEALAQVGRNGSVAVNGLVTTDGATLLSGQRLNSVTTVQTIVGSESGIRVTGPLPGSQGVIRGRGGKGGNPVITLANNVIVEGLEIEGGKMGIYGDSIQNAVVKNNKISGADVDGLQLTTFFTGMVVGNLSENNGQNGFTIEGNEGMIADNIANLNEDSGFLVEDNVGKVMNNVASENNRGFELVRNMGVVKNNAATFNDDDGFLVLRNDGVIKDNASSENGDDGFDFFFGNNGLVAGNTADDNEDNGFSFAENNLLALGNAGTVSGNSATGNGEDGFFFLSNVGDIEGNSATSNGDDGYSFTTNFGIVKGNDAQSNNDYGFSLLSNNGTLEGNTSSFNARDGFRVFGSNRGLIEGNTATSNADDGFQIGSRFSPNRGTIRGNVANSNVDDGYNIRTSRFSGTEENNTGSGNGDNDNFGPR